ncbi:MAG: class I SAM-dependent methyltransferase [Cellvibrionaceae bacterium]|nr:class I SAM-dependent methyltransferase [Cellvibrionaceae bacterium]
MNNIAEFLAKKNIKGFLADDEGQALYDFALRAENLGPCLEIGSYCGKSAVYLGSACKVSGNVLFTIDHHCGSEEQQPGQAYFDKQLFDVKTQRINSFPHLQKTLQLADLSDCVIPVVAASQLVCRFWQETLGLVFVDGGHSHHEAMADCENWARRVAPGGFLAVHDIFSQPEMGGQGPYLALQQVLSSGEFTKLARVNSLEILQRI